MDHPRSIAIPRIESPSRLTAAYVLFGSVWSLASDAVVSALATDARSHGLLGAGKNLLFVAVTAALLHVILTRRTSKLRQIETELKRQEQRWREAVEAVGDGIWEADLTAKRVYYSAKWKTMLGYAEEEIGPGFEEWSSRVHPEDLARAEAEIQSCLQGTKPDYSCEYRMRAKNGSYRWIHSRGRLLPAPGDEPGARMIGTHTDVTSRKQIEMETRDALSFAQAVLKSSSIGIIAFRADGPTVISNEAAARMVGTDVPTMLTGNFRELASWRAGLLAGAERALATDQEVVHHGLLRTGFGRELWIEAHLVPFIYSGTPHLLLLMSDRTSERQTSAELHLMQQAVEAAPVGWVVTDAEGRIEWVNPGFTKLTGYTPDAVVGQSTRFLKSGRHRPEFYATMWQTIRGGEVWSGELINKRQDGTLYHEYSTIAPVRGEDGSIRHFVMIKQDITEQKMLEQKSSRSQRLESIGLLACGMAHDLNNMLSPILLSLGLIRVQPGDKETADCVQVMEAAAKRGAGVLRQVLTFGQGLEGERIALEPKHLIKEIAQLAEETFLRQIKIETTIGRDVHQVRGDMTQLHQVLLNLAVNARDAMPEGGVLTLHAENVLVDEARAARQVTPAKAGAYVSLGVRDTGTGIPPEVLEHMFEPFYTTKPRGKGTGLGLSTVFGLVRSHGGFVEVETEVGRGTDISILLPAVIRPVASTPPNGRMAITLTGGGRRVLVVDDEEGIRNVTRSLLEKRGFVMVGAKDGVEGLSRFSENPTGFVAVIMDLMMPNMNGYQLAGQIRRLSPAIPILASSGMTGSSPEEDIAATLRTVGITRLLRKPYAERTLFEALQQCLAPPAPPSESG